MLSCEELMGKALGSLVLDLFKSFFLEIKCNSVVALLLHPKDWILSFILTI